MKYKPEHIKYWNWNKFSVSLWDLFKEDSLGKSILKYKFRDTGKLIFEGQDFAASPMHAIDSLDTIVGLLGFLTLKPGDTDKEYFDKYTPEQMAWCQSDRCDLLGLYVYDYEQRRQKRNCR